jgi:hypothetical protein
MFTGPVKDAYNCQYYHANKSYFAEKGKMWRKAKRQRLDGIKLAHGCVNPACQHSGVWLPCQLEFHHIDPATKRGQVANVCTRSDEIAKCCVLCGNCHALATAGLLDTSSFPRCA